MRLTTHCRNEHKPHNINTLICTLLNPGSARSKAWVCDHSLVGIVGSNLPVGEGWGHRLLSVLSVVCCQVEVSVSG